MRSAILGVVVALGGCAVDAAMHEESRMVGRVIGVQRYAVPGGSVSSVIGGPNAMTIQTPISGPMEYYVYRIRLTDGRTAIARSVAQLSVGECVGLPASAVPESAGTDPVNLSALPLRPATDCP